MSDRTDGSDEEKYPFRVDARIERLTVPLGLTGIRAKHKTTVLQLTPDPKLRIGCAIILGSLRSCVKDVAMGRRRRDQNLFSLRGKAERIQASDQLEAQ